MKRRQRNRAMRNGRAKGSGHVRWTFTPNRPLACRIAAEIIDYFEGPGIIVSLDPVRMTSTSDRADPFEEAGIWPSEGSEIPPCPEGLPPLGAHDWTDEPDQAERTCVRCKLPLPRPAWAAPSASPAGGAQ